MLLGWQEQSLVKYIGNEFNIGFKNGDMDNLRYIYARFRYKKLDNLRRGQLTPTRNWYLRYTGDGIEDDDGPNKVPRGTNMISRLTYNAVERSVTITNMIDGGQIKMRVNAAVWFIIQLVMLVPFRVL
jgi:hypothetical protein